MLAGRQLRKFGVALDDHRHEGAHPNDSVSRVVPKPFEDTDDKFRPRAGVTHRRQNFGVIQPSDTVRHLEIDPAHRNTVTKPGDPFVADLKFHVVP